MFSYLDETNVFKKYKDAKKYTDSLTEPFPEFERIARNRPHDDIDENYPRTTDGTTASIIRKTPRRIIQQLPTGSVVSDSNDWLTHVANFIYTKKILPCANEEYDLIQKAWTVVEKSLTFGSCPTYAPFLNHDGYLSPDCSVIYWGNIAIPKGKKSGYSLPYVFMESWWQKEDIEALIDSQSKLSKDVEKSWDVPSLEEVLEAIVEKDKHQSTPSENDRNVDGSGILLVTGFQKGVGAKFFTFNPQKEVIVRTKKNKDPRGKMPIDWMYGDIDGTNPLGRGIVELIGGLQNLIDSDMQMYQYNRALMLDPPLLKRGSMGKSKVRYAVHEIIDLGTDPTNSVEAMKVDTSAVINYPQLYGLQKSQLLNLVNSPDTSISAEVGNPNFSKTTAGVNQQATVISVDDNFVRKMFESWFQHWSETAVNLWFAERSGKDEIQLDQQTAQRLRELPGFDENLLSEDNKIRIDYDTETPALKFRVDPSTTSVKDNAAQLQDATNLLDLVMKYPMLDSSYGGPIDRDVLARRIVNTSGIEDPEQVAPEPTAQEIQQKEQAKQQTSPFSPMFDKPKISISYLDLPPAAQVQLLANAGIRVGMQDVMQGPVLDINARGNMDVNPMNDPNVQLPGQQPGQPNTPAASPVDLGDIYKTTTDPSVKAEIEAMAGLHPDAANVQNQAATNQTQHLATQSGNIAQAAQTMSPAPTQSLQSQQPPEKGQSTSPQQTLNPHDQAIAAHLLHLGATPVQIQQALAMLDSGKSDQEVLQMLAGAQHGR